MITAVKTEAAKTGAAKKPRFAFIDDFRGLIIVLMLMDHASTYLNAMWRNFDPLDPLFGSWGQVALRYSSYLCAPGFLMVSGAMVWYSWTRRRAAGDPPWRTRWQLLRRGLFLVLLQMTWVNSSWGGFQEFKPGHLGIIATIGMAMCLLALVVGFPWWARLGMGLGILAVHPLLLRIAYDPEKLWPRVVMQTFVDAGEFNKYPLLPWFALALVGSVMAHIWLRSWRRQRDWALANFGIAAASGLAALAVRLARGYGNISPFSALGHFSFFYDQKYPPSLFYSLWFIGAVSAVVALFELIGRRAPGLLAPFGVVGRVPLFFYCLHIAILGVFSKRIGLFYLQGGVSAALLGTLVVLAVMFPLAIWFGGVKRRSGNWVIQMI